MNQTRIASKAVGNDWLPQCLEHLLGGTMSDVRKQLMQPDVHFMQFLTFMALFQDAYFSSGLSFGKNHKDHEKSPSR